MIFKIYFSLVAYKCSIGLLQNWFRYDKLLIGDLLEFLNHSEFESNK
jgi:hypothetical protein